ncbi:Na+/H+ antiporter subunit G [Xylanimonas oleitrophica]|uniref:Na+/H+ antiporter subunit G n=1 Tax=Xylanimonas oleitrophica TaxID=2607479 RepID=A0A2W5YHI1_9MICO|nr:Na+/H+ antiporter subunit G [Xylanimonas oleitrophica]
MADVLAVLLLAAGCFFVVAGTLGLLRFADLPTRLHGVAKADNLGLGFITAGLVVHALAHGGGIAGGGGGAGGIVAKLVLVWLFALLGTAANSHLLAAPARPEPGAEEKPEREPGPGPGPETTPEPEAPATREAP